MAPPHGQPSRREIRRLLDTGRADDRLLLYRFVSGEVPAEFYPALFRNLPMAPLADRLRFLNRLPPLRHPWQLRYWTPLLADPEAAVREAADRVIQEFLILPRMPSWGPPEERHFAAEGPGACLAEANESFLGELKTFWPLAAAVPGATERLLDSLGRFHENGSRILAALAECASATDRRRFAERCEARAAAEYPRQLMVALTYDCQLHCSYCFNRHRAGESMPEEIFSLILQWMRRDGSRRICFLGGEPTLYPHFLSCLRQCREEGLKVYFNSNGLFGKKILEALEPESILHLGLHLAEGETYRGDQKKRFLRTLEGLAGKGISVALRINAHSLEDNYGEEALRLCESFRVSRLHFALPFPAEGCGNRYVAPGDIRRFGPMIYGLIEECTSRGICLVLAKPLPFCLFPLQSWRRWLPHHDLFHSCGIARSDGTQNALVHPDGSVTPCMGTESPRRALLDFADRRELGACFGPPIRSRLGEPCRPACRSCLLFRERKCQGLCLAYPRTPAPAAGPFRKGDRERRPAW